MKSEAGDMLGQFLGALLPDVGGWIVGAVLALIAGLFGWARLASGRASRATERAEAAQANVKTRERMDDAENVVGDDPDAARRWLHERGRR
jgi:uncharacterized membrane protein